ncbi:hypothetical protein B0H34DRAFT_743864 [Crassisporium funariophilum]|nr:hypothetical protein B0H34DRAFT_743864 [Crassisporium funariophilum]
MVHLLPYLFFSLSAWLHLVLAARNVTIDDQDPSIIYAPPGAWSKSADNALNSGGAHMLTQNPNATASFNFTGIAIYFLSPLWPYRVNTAVSLDSGPIALIDLVDHSRPDAGQGPETVQSHVMWSATGLSNAQHNLRISVGAGQPFGIVDALIFTDPSDLTSITPPPSRTTTYTDRNIPPPTGTSSPESSKRANVVPIAVGSVFGILALLLIMFAVWFFCRRRTRPISETWTIDGTSSIFPSRGPSMGPGGMSPINAYASGSGTTAQQLQPHEQGYYLNQTNQGAWQNPRYGHVGMAAPPIPPQLNSYHTAPYPQNSTSPQPPGYYHAPPIPGRAPNRYEPGYTLSTITEKSTPQMGEGRTPLAHSPASLPSEVGGNGYHPAAPPVSEGVSSGASGVRFYGMQKEEGAARGGEFVSPRRAPAKPADGKPHGYWI